MSKFQRRTFVKPIEKKIHENFQTILLWFEVVVAFWIFAPIESHVNENEKQNCEKLETQNFKNPKQYFCEDHWEENSKVWCKNQSDLNED